MSVRTVSPIIFIFVALSVEGYSQEPLKWEDRINDLQLNRLNLGAFSTLFEASSVTTRLGEKRASQFHIYVSRLVSDGKSRRFDSFRESISENSDVSLYYHILQLPGQRSSVSDFRFGGGAIKTTNENSKYVFFEPMDPFLQCLQPYTGVNNNITPGIKHLTNCIFVEDTVTADGNYSVFLLRNSRGAGVQVTFAKQPEWAPVQADFYSSLDAKPVGSNPDAAEYKLKWRLYSQTKTKWSQIAEDTWVPQELFVTQCADDEDRREIEIFLTDWKVGKDVDKQLLEEKNFTMEQIKSTVNFRTWKEKIEAARKPIKVR